MHVINPSIQMTFCMECSAKKHSVQTGNCQCGTGSQITNLKNNLIVSILLAFPVWNLSLHLSQLVLEFCPWLFFEVNWLGSQRSTFLWILLSSKV